MAKRTKIVDKWKAKKWYSIEAPAIFDNTEICEVVAADEKSLKDRIIRYNFSRLMSARTQLGMFTSVLFRVTDIGAVNAKTKLIGHEIAPSFLKTFARRGKTLGHYVVDVKTKDGESVRLKAIAVASGHISATTKKNLGKKIVEEINSSATTLSYDDLMKDILFDRFTPKIMGKIKEITSMRRFEIRKSERKEVFA